MSDFPSISQLLGNQSQAVSKPAPIKGTQPTVEEKFQKKMTEVSAKEKELDTVRFSQQINLPYINLERFPVSQEALRQVPKAMAQELQAVCFLSTQDELRIGAIDPTSEQVQELLFQLQERNRANGMLYVISQASFEKVYKLYETLPVIKPITKDILIKSEELEKVQDVVTDFASFQTLLQKNSTTDVVTHILGAALKLDASDVHVEAEEQKIIVRFRLDGILHDAGTMPKESYKKLVARIKLVAAIKINIANKPQDGRFTIKTEDGEVDVRVSTIPTVYGESIVLRLLRQNKNKVTFDSLGLRGSAYDKLKREIERPNGMIITTGPTGSGKTTTMYAVIQTLNKPGVKIITLEDPVEYKMEGVNQSQIDMTKDYTFAKGLRSMLRQDPDIAMVGEIRDLETAETSIQAALTGHLMLSTIHTNNASGAVPRFLSIGVKPFLLAPALNCVIGQRLVRKVCQQCKTINQLTPDIQARVDAVLDGLPELEKRETQGKSFVFYKGTGCEECGGIGYKGRVGIYEIFVVDDEIEQLINAGDTTESAMERIAVEKGMVTMVQDGILKAADGITSVEEVFRVIE